MYQREAKQYAKITYLKYIEVGTVRRLRKAALTCPFLSTKPRQTDSDSSIHRSLRSELATMYSDTNTHARLLRHNTYNMDQHGKVFTSGCSVYAGVLRHPPKAFQPAPAGSVPREGATGIIHAGSFVVSIGVSTTKCSECIFTNACSSTVLVYCPLHNF